MARRRRVNRDLKLERERKYRLRSRAVGKGAKFIPNGDSDFAHMAKIFASHVQQHAERFRIPAEQVAKLMTTVNAFRAALTTTMRPSTCGPRATSIKNTAREQAEKIVRAVASVLRACDSLTPVDRTMLNLNERPKRLKRRECPQIAPVLRFIGSTDPYRGAVCGGGRHILEYGNDFDRASNAKPHGAARLELFVELVPVGQPVPQHPGERSGGRLWYLQSFSTSRFEVELPVLNDGTPALVVYWGRWADARGGVGPFSKTCIARVEGGFATDRALPGAQRKAFCVEHLPSQLAGLPGVEAQWGVEGIAIQSGPMYALPEGERAKVALLEAR